MNNKEQFAKIYEESLREAIDKYPNEYIYSHSLVPSVVAKMMNAIENNSFNKDGRAFIATCKKLNIKYTYKAILEYYNK